MENVMNAENIMLNLNVRDLSIVKREKTDCLADKFQFLEIMTCIL